MSKRSYELYLEDILVSISRNSDIPWREIVGLRNKVAYEYFGVNVDILWQTIKEDLVNLKQQVKNLNA